jgi:hypothetical protein
MSLLLLLLCQLSLLHCLCCCCCPVLAGCRRLLLLHLQQLACWQAAAPEQPWLQDCCWGCFLPELTCHLPPTQHWTLQAPAILLLLLCRLQHSCSSQ